MINQYSRFEFRGEGIMYLLIWVASYLFSIITLYLATPWLYCWRVGWLIGNSYINNRRLIFKGTGIQVFGLFLWILFASIFTLGLYIPFGIIRIEKWKFENTFFEDEIFPEKRLSQNNDRDVISHHYDRMDFNLLPPEQLGEKTLDVTCINCNSRMELEKHELKANLFICPICKTENNVHTKQAVKIEEHSNENVNIDKIDSTALHKMEEKDFTCIKCNSIVTLEGEELESETYTCPVCDNENKTQMS